MRYIFLLLFFILLFSVKAQKKNLYFENISDLKINYPRLVTDSVEAKKQAQLVLSSLYRESYLSASIDSSAVKEDSIVFYVLPGKRYKWINLNKGNLTENEVSEIDLNSKLFLNRPFNARQLSLFFEKGIKYYENHGYPFVSFSLDSVQLDTLNQITASIKLEKNRFYKIDSLIVLGNTGIKKNYLSQYLNIQEGMPYNETSIRDISLRITEIPFIEERSKAQVQYYETGVKVLLNLKKKKASRFDGILGLLSSEETGKIDLTGDVDLNLINSFNRGESIGFNWRKLKGNSQDLNLEFEYPFLFNTPFGIDFDFNLFKRDTTFIDVISRLGIKYLIRRGESVSLFIENKSSNLLSKNSLVVRSGSSLPTLGDVSVNSFGVSYQTDRTDYKYNPTKGLYLFTSFAVGKKKLKKIAQLEAENPSIYENVKLSTTQYNALLKSGYYFPINPRNTIKLANQSAQIYSENIYTNELLRIGGLKLLRGFDEESINASSYSIFTLEYRFLLDRNSYFSLFSDGGYYENKSEGEYISDTPFGLGAGISFETKAGIFTFNYAVGKQFDNPIQLRAAKIHFGFINFF